MENKKSKGGAEKRGLKREKPWRHMQPNVQKSAAFSIKRARGLKQPMKTMKRVRQEDV